MWKYNRVEIEYDHIDELNEKLNDYGSEEWEAISYSETKASKFGEKNVSIVLFKKEK